MMTNNFIITVSDGFSTKDYLMTGGEAQTLADALESGKGNYEISITHPSALQQKTAEEVLTELGYGDVNPAPGYNWVEDYEYEPDHQYVCLCRQCRHVFFGNKGRIVCKLCSQNNKV